MSNILILSSSPRPDGNTNAICDELKKGAEAAGKKVFKFNLDAMNIGHCKACEQCHMGKDTCVIQDDMQQVLEALKEADGLVLATPVYFWNMSGQLKTAIDRTYSIYRKLKLKNTALIAVSAGTKPEMMEPVIAGYKGYVACLRGPKDVGVLTFTGDVSDDERSKEILQKAYELGGII